MICLIDGDIVAYRAAAASENEEDWVAVARAKATIEKILENLGLTQYQVWLSDSKDNNFRYKIFPSYKANRTKPSPKWLDITKTYLKGYWGAQTASGEEADDALGIRQSDNTIICSIDKDMLMIPGNHYNFVNEESIFVSEFEALRNFYFQLMMGDRVDNINKPEHLKGYGKVKIANLLGECGTEAEMFNAVRNKYNNDDLLLINGRLLWIRRRPNELWEFPCLNTEQCVQHEVDQKSSYSQPKPKETSLLSELI